MHTTGKPLQQKQSANSQKGSSLASRRGTGPRTAIGKQRTKYNALKHGLFAKVVLSHESKSQFDDLVCELQRDLVPKGMLQELLVEKIATNFWRYRRLLQAESATVQKNIEAQADHDAGFSRESLRIQAYLEKVRSETNRRGALPEIDDFPESLEYCLDKLNMIGEDADRYGLECDSHKINLGLVYGARYSGRLGTDLFDYYLGCLSALNATAAERKSRGFESEVDCVQKFIAETKKEIARLAGHQKRPIQKAKALPVARDDQPRGIKLLELEIPHSGQQDRLLEYEANLDRGLDRALIQLERLQRMRDSQKTIELT